jgi:hypothetical protein
LLFRKAFTNVLILCWLAVLLTLPPNLGAFGAVAADIDIAAPFKDGGAEVPVCLVLPDVGKAAVLQGAHLVLRILVEAAGYDTAIPGDHGTVPHFPAMFVRLFFNAQRITLYTIGEAYTSGKPFL